MKFNYLLIIILFFTKNLFAQSNIVHPLPATNNKPAIDTLGFNKHDSLPFATFCFYRSYIPKFNAPIKKVPIYINDSLVYKLKANNIITIKVYKEGKFRIAIDEKGDSEIQTKVKFGKEYFFKCEVEKGLWFGKPTIESVTPAEGKKELGI